MSNLPGVRHVIEIEEPEFKQAVSLEDKTYSIGRHSSNSIVLLSPVISRHHATLVRVKYPDRKDAFWIVDGDLKGNKSANGVSVNGIPCSSQELKNRDTILLGGKIRATYKIVDASNKTVIRTNNKSKEKETIIINDKGIATLTSVQELDESGKEFISQMNRLPSLLPFSIVEIDLEGEIVYTNPAANREFEDLREEKINHPILAELLKGVQTKQGKFFIREVKIGKRVFEQYVHYLAQEKIVRSYIFDSTQRRQIEAALWESEERYRAVIEQISEGIFLVDAADKQIVEANAAYCKLLGYTTAEILRLTLYDVVALDRATIDSELEHILSNRVASVVESVHRKKDASLVSVEAGISLIRYGGKEVLCLTVRDITERKRAEEMLQYYAFHDLLTDLPNRMLFNKRLATFLADAKRKQHLMAVLFLDLDRFKNINDTLGHAVGDRLLQAVAERLKTCLRSGDTVARWGGDEFTVLLPHVKSLEYAARVGQRILDALKQPFAVEDHQLHVSGSIGVAVYPQDGKDADTLVKHADAALYRSKEQGRSQYQFYSPTMTSRVSNILKLENYLHQALEKQEFLLYYQPQINIRTGKVFGMEALLRWKHSELGFVSPGAFIPLAEETNLIVPIGEWVLKTACAQNRAWQEIGLPPIRIGVNLSPQQFQQSNLSDLVQRTLRQTKLAPQWLELEITETTIMQDVDFARQTLQALKDMGVHVSMDDFGTGYSSLSYLKQFPFHTLKIDQSFVKELKDVSQDLAIISAIVALGKGFNLRVIAEGVETVEQAKLLRRLQCEEMQGYWFSRPLKVADATKFLACNHTFSIE